MEQGCQAVFPQPSTLQKLIIIRMQSSHLYCFCSSNKCNNGQQIMFIIAQVILPSAFLALFFCLPGMHQYHFL
jgi:hypothetical protein